MAWLEGLRRGGAPRGGQGEEAFDVVVVGLGCAGGSAAIEAADRGARVLVLDRFDGGGATERCGGVVYAGGGTPTQRAAGVEDSVDAMLAYLRTETGDAVPEETLRAFCESSAESIAWLEGLGVPFPPRVFEGKTSYPPDDHGLYYSGNEKQRAHVARPAPRGHVPGGVGQTGHVISEALRRAVLSRGVEVRYGSQPTALVRDDGGAVVGVEVRALADVEPLRRIHRLLFQLGSVARGLGGAIDGLERAAGRRYRVRARGGVVIAAGGFVFDAAMLREHAPAYAGCVPLGTAGDDGRGIRLGLSAGGALALMDSCAACRFVYPPEALVSGLLVDERGERVCDESLYGATLSRAISTRQGGRAFLVVDAKIADRARAETQRDERLRDRPLGQVLSGAENALIYRKVTALLNLHLNRRSGSTLAELEGRCGMPAGALARTVAAHNERVRAGGADPLGKPPGYAETLDRPPFLAIGCALSSPLFPSPTFTLGGLETEGTTARVLGEDGAAIPGLYAAGRSAAGICRRSYVSGLSLADCVFSGRNAGRSAAAAARSRSAYTPPRGGA